MSKNIRNKIPVLSFYSGGGFMDMGFEKAGFEIVWTNEFDETFAKLHAAGITSWRKSIGNATEAEIFNTKSITEISSEEIVNEAFPNGKPRDFGMIGGPPCQDFSINGKLKGFSGERGKLTVIYFNKILELLPSFFVMENVTGLVRRKETNDFLNKLLKRIKRKYNVDSKILNSLNYGVPQNRERVFFIGVRKDLLKRKIKSNWFPFPVNEQNNDVIKKYGWADKTPFGETPIRPLNLKIELCVESCLVAPESELKIYNANEYFPLRTNLNKLLNIQEGETNRPSFKRLHRYRYSPTACYGNNEVHLHPYQNRRLSVREALRIQGVPEGYILPSELSMSKKFKMIGNGVPVPLAEAIATALKNFLDKISEMKK
ncbi:DNA cytosine methyltransferase [Pedobacter sp. SL55]|uniref:DNA cytosine methyltransferase n=1 Tax=Pedobacter sp. SL55 TaxID=2995161 RepID=UPI00226F331A|nr:DNA cytosine methyltransferase [Pedobacter sp. SL55]WAC41067.1 DNA cytosine methyltransferase [Pedobacter sp. SL55]